MKEAVPLMAKAISDKSSSPTIVIERTGFTQDDFDVTFAVDDARRPFREVVSKWLSKKFPPTKHCFMQEMFAMFPFIQMLRSYQWKRDLITDVVAGMCCCVTLIPMSIAFTFLAAVPPVYGIYSAFFPILTYFFIGGSHHISVHTMALIALMVGAVVDREVIQFKLDSIDDNAMETMIKTNKTMLEALNQTNSLEVDAFSVDISASITLLAGLFQILMSLLRLGVLGTYMSVPYVSGFLLGACCHIILSQIPLVLGIHIRRVSGIGELLKKIFMIFANIGKANPATVINGICCIIFLVVIKEVINNKYSHKLKIPIPAEIIVVVICSTISYLGNFKGNFGMATVANVPLGLPAPRIPAMTNASNYLVDAVLVAIISYVISLSLAKSYARKYKYQVDPNHEMFAYGVSNAIGGIFSCFAGAAAPPICCVQETSRGKSQIVSFVSCVIVLIVCLFAGPLIEPLPNSSLGAIVIVALLPMFRRLTELKLLWYLNKWDVAVWMVTWCSVLFFDVIFGAGIGMAFNLIVLTLQHQMVRGQKLANAKGTEIYISRNRYKALIIPPRIVVYYFGSSLVFANADKFKDDLFKAIGREEESAIVNTQLIDEMCVREVDNDESDIRELQMTTEDGHQDKLIIPSSNNAKDSLNLNNGKEITMKSVTDVNLIKTANDKTQWNVKNGDKNHKTNENNGKQNDAMGNKQNETGLINGKANGNFSIDKTYDNGLMNDKPNVNGLVNDKPCVDGLMNDKQNGELRHSYTNTNGISISHDKQNGELTYSYATSNSEVKSDKYRKFSQTDDDINDFLTSEKKHFNEINPFNSENEISIKGGKFEINEKNVNVNLTPSDDSLSSTITDDHINVVNNNSTLDLKELDSPKLQSDLKIIDKQPHSLVVDCSAIGFMDIVGLNTISQISSILKGRNIRLVLAQCTHSLLQQLKAIEFSGIKFIIYPTVHDAIIVENFLFSNTQNE